jgi:hypothetical protein
VNFGEKLGDLSRPEPTCVAPFADLLLNQHRTAFCPLSLTSPQPVVRLACRQNLASISVRPRVLCSAISELSTISSKLTNCRNSPFPRKTEVSLHQ